MKKALLGLVAFLSSISAFAEEAVATTAATASTGDGAFIAIAAGVAISLAAMGGALGQGKVGAAAMDGIARNPQAQKDMFVPMIVGLALIESLVIYALLIAFMLVGKI